jgi:uncharacterized protein (DUF1697 family)
MAHGWVALLRAVNLGAVNKVPMARLRELLEEGEYESVATYIQSGNVLFVRGRASDRKRLAKELERAIQKEFGVASAVVLRTFAEVEKLVQAHPFGGDTSQTHVAFLAATPTAKAVRALEELDIGADRFEIRGSDVFMHYPNGVQGSRLASRLEKTLGVPGTVRTWRTVTKLAEMTKEARVG